MPASIVFVVKPRGNTYYVATTGSDEADGSIGTPWATLTYAASQLEPGDTLYLRGGTWNERLVVPKSGEPGKWITYEAYPGETPIIDGDGLTIPSWGSLVQMVTKSYIRIKGLTVKNARTPGVLCIGIMARDECDHIEILDNTVTNTNSSGILVGWGSTAAADSNSYITVTGNDISYANHRVAQEALTICNVHHFEVAYNHVHWTYKECIDVKVSSSHGTIHHNVVHDCPGAGIYLDARPISHVDIYDNFVYNLHKNGPSGEVQVWAGFYANMPGIALNSEPGDTIDYINVYNNIVDDVSYNGFSIGNSNSHETTRIRHVNVYNNTFERCGNGGINGTGAVQSNIVLTQPRWMEDINIFNNILWRRVQYDNWGSGINLPNNSKYATACTIETGNQTNTYAATTASDSTYHIVEDDAGTTSFYYEFDEYDGESPATSISWYGYAQPSTATIDVYAYNWSTEAWVQITSFTGTDAATNQSKSWSLSSVYSEVGDGSKKVQIKLVSSTATAIATDIIYSIYPTLVADYGDDLSIHHNLFEYHSPSTLGDDYIMLEDGEDVEFVNGEPSLGVVNTYPESCVVTTGSETNTYASTLANDNAYHIVEDDGGDISFYYEFSNYDGEGRARAVYWRFYAQPATAVVAMYAYNWDTETWVNIYNWSGTDAATEQAVPFNLLDAAYTGGDGKKVRIKFESSTAAVIATDEIYCRNQPDMLTADGYKLLGTCLAIDAGATVDLDEDYYGNSRPQGLGYDIGAFEYTPA